MPKKIFLALLCLMALVLPVLSESKYSDLSVDELNAAIKSGKVAIIDCNSVKRYQSGHIPGAISYELVGDKLASKLPKDKSTLVVAYCGGPMCRAYQAGADAARALGYKNIKHLSAGISGWEEAEMPTEK